MKRTIAAAAVFVCLSCGGAPPLIKLPAGPGAPAADAADVFAEAIAACRAVRTVSAEVAVSGLVGGKRVRGRLLAGVAAPASVRIEAVAPFGPPAFILVAHDNDATLILPRDDRVLEHGRPDAVLEAVTGVPVGAADLRATLTGCASSPQVTARQVGDWRIVTPAGAGDRPVEREWYLRRERAAGMWRLVTAVHRSADGPWRAEYGDFQSGLPRSIRLASENSKGFDLALTLSQMEVNRPLEADVFTVRIPRSASLITLEELRRSGPFGTTAADAR